MSSSWSASQYVKFEAERNRPVRDLLAQLPAGAVARAADIGCGPGNSTALLQARFPTAAIIGMDRSDDMIDAARARLPAVTFSAGDITAWAGDASRFDVILANAVLQWVPDHASLLPGLLRRLAPGGSLAVQMPDNLDEPAHVLMRCIAADGAWAARLATAVARRVQHTADWYFGVLRTQGAAVNMWRTTYFHVLQGGAAAVVDWFLGSSLRPFLAQLNEGERDEFLARYAAMVAEAYPAQPDGTVLLPFPRLLFIATVRS